MSDRAELSHQIATKAARQIVNEGVEAGLAWSDIAKSCETAVAIVVVACAELSGAANDTQFATEIVEMITHRAHQRVTALMLGVPDAG